MIFQVPPALSHAGKADYFSGLARSFIWPARFLSKLQSMKALILLKFKKHYL
jgi:hypothetical protein